MFYLIVYAYFINKVAMAFFDDYITLLVSANTAIKLVLFVLINKFMYCKIKICGGLDYSSLDPWVNRKATVANNVLAPSLICDLKARCLA